MGGGVRGDFVITRVGGVGEVCVVGWLVDGDGEGRGGEGYWRSGIRGLLGGQCGLGRPGKGG